MQHCARLICRRVACAVRFADWVREGWTELYDTRTGRVYYHNKKLKKQQWEPPVLARRPHVSGPTAQCALTVRSFRFAVRLCTATAAANVRARFCDDMTLSLYRVLLHVGTGAHRVSIGASNTRCDVSMATI